VVVAVSPLPSPPRSSRGRNLRQSAKSGRSPGCRVGGISAVPCKHSACLHGRGLHRHPSAVRRMPCVARKAACPPLGGYAASQGSPSAGASGRLATCGETSFPVHRRRGRVALPSPSFPAVVVICAFLRICARRRLRPLPPASSATASRASVRDRNLPAPVVLSRSRTSEAASKHSAFRRGFDSGRVSGPPQADNAVDVAVRLGPYDSPAIRVASSAWP
jgi:hypothetical protein